MSKIKRMEVKGVNWIVTSEKGIKYLIVNLENTKKYDIYTNDNRFHLGEVELIKDMASIINNFEEIYYTELGTLKKEMMISIDEVVSKGSFK